LLRYKKDGPELYCFDKNNNILKNNLCKKNAAPCAEVNPKFSDQLIEALIGGENFFSQNKSCQVSKDPSF
jgi:hypothetical protein